MALEQLPPPAEDPYADCRQLINQLECNDAVEITRRWVTRHGIDCYLAKAAAKADALAADMPDWLRADVAVGLAVDPRVFAVQSRLPSFRRWLQGLIGAN